MHISITISNKKPKLSNSRGKKQVLKAPLKNKIFAVTTHQYFPHVKIVTTQTRIKQENNFLQSATKKISNTRKKDHIFTY